MFSTDQMEKIALAECVAMFGKSFINANKKHCASTYGFDENGLFSYALGVDTKSTEYRIGGETPMEFHAFVIVDPKTGTVTRDYKRSTLPQ